MKKHLTFAVIFVSTCIAFVTSFTWMGTNLLVLTGGYTYNEVFHNQVSVSLAVISVLLTVWLAVLLLLELNCKFKLPHRK